ncbi:hypothetical protein POLEWNIK_00180 [Brevundimonas phage vB_BpoS-Polewnik]|nr:hypothetical protein POLEWNIK_00180 [Brevundimonas phage vB_BpoS-Polewnik]
MAGQPWELTGKTRYRHHWVWYGWVNFRLKLVLEVEEQKDVYDPIFSGHSPANWVANRRWRPASTEDLSHLSLKFGVFVGSISMTKPGEPSQQELETLAGAARWRLVEALRSQEGDSVLILSDNPDGPPNNAIEVCGAWTDWKEVRYDGETLNDALLKAIAARNEHDNDQYPFKADQ